VKNDGYFIGKLSSDQVFAKDPQKGRFIARKTRDGEECFAQKADG